jgi:hypothetical protein
MALYDGTMNKFNRYITIILLIILVFIGCKDRKKDTVSTTDEVNPNVKGNKFLMSEKCYSIEIQRLNWIVVKNKSRYVDLALHSRKYPGTFFCYGHKVFSKSNNLEKTANNVIERLTNSRYQIIEKKPIEIAKHKGILVKSKGEVNLKDLKNQIPRIITCSVIQIGKYVYELTFICKPEEYDLCEPDYKNLLDNFKTEKYASKNRWYENLFHNFDTGKSPLHEDHPEDQ